MKTKKHILHIALGLVLGLTAASAHSDAFEPTFVDTLVEPYLGIQKGLAGDDLQAAQSGAADLLAKMKLAPHEDGAQHDAEEISTPAKSIAEASDLGAARGAFQVLTGDMLALVQDVGTTGKTPLYVAHCPMAFSGAGADWIQAGKTVANPYYGAMMLRCGGIQKQINGEAGKPMEHKAPAGTHEGHGHSMQGKPASSVGQSKLDAIHADVPGYPTPGSDSSAQCASPTKAAPKMSCCGN